MSQSYQRYQIILTEASPDFSVRGKKAFGKCILEARGDSGKISFNVQNLKPGIICNAYIAAADNGVGLAINIGRIIASDTGNAEIKWECSAGNVDNSGLPLKVFNVAGMMIFGENIVSAPIIGFKDGEVEWEKNLRVHSNNTQNMENISDVSVEEQSVGPNPEESSEAPPIAQDEEPITEEPASPGELSQAKPFIISLAEAATILKTANAPPLPDTPAIPPEEFFETTEEGPAEKAFKDIANKINDKLNEIDALTSENPQEAENAPDYSILSDIENQHLQSIFQSCSKIRPFKNQDSDEEWVRITPNELNFLPDEFAHLHTNPLIISAYRKFNHLVLGRKQHSKRVDIAFGMPDIYAAAAEDHARAAGLMWFKCCDCEEILEGRHGYWLKIVKYG